MELEVTAMTSAVVPSRAGRIPSFPDFKPLELSDRAEVTAITDRFPCYSDFNFVSLWTWDTASDTELAMLNGNLVVKLRDYVTQQRFLTFIGASKPVSTAVALLEAAPGLCCAPQLALVPHSVAVRMKQHPSVDVREDRDGADYILSAPANAVLEGPDYRGRRKQVRQFELAHAPRVTIKAGLLAAVLDRAAVLEIFDIWAASAGASADANTERAAHARVFDVADVASLHGIALWLDGDLRGFSILEDVTPSTMTVHFSKADRSVSGIFPWLSQQEARYATRRGVRFLNIEQDLGLVGLRASKTKDRPVEFLRKYIVSLGDR